MLALETQGLASCSINWPEDEQSERKIQALINSRLRKSHYVNGCGYAEETVILLSKNAMNWSLRSISTVIIEIREAGFVNKGAELMLHASLQKLQEAFPEATFTVTPTPESGSHPYSRYSLLGLKPKAFIWRKGIPFGDLASLIPGRLREMFGVVLDKEVDVVIDASGFSYTDQFGETTSKNLALYAKRWQKNETKVILLPQAFGPFKNGNIQNYVQEFTKYSDLIFARDDVSFKYLTELSPQAKNIQQCPDFTNLVQGTLPKGWDTEANRVCIVPNYRMIDKTSAEESQAYLDFMIACTKYLKEKNAKPFLLVQREKWP